MKDTPVGDIPPRIVGNVKCHQGEVIQMPLPHVLPTIDDLRVMFEGLFLIGRHRDWCTGVLVG